MNKVKKYIYIIIGLISFVLGAIGIIMPILPTTPFLLLSSFCFARGSEKFNKWFLGTKIYKKHLESFVKNREMTLKQKVCILAFADFMIAIPLILAEKLWVKLLLSLVIIIKLYYFIFKIKTVKKTAEI